MEKRTVIDKKRLLVRHARADDCEDIWKWRNTPVGRQFSFSQEEIPLPDHRIWFDKKIKDESSVIYILENSQKVKVGQARFQIMPDNTASISVNMNPQYIGRGLGVSVITEATRTLFNEKPKLISVQAEVLIDNIASKKVFQRAGYSRLGQYVKQGKEALLFVIENKNYK